MTLGALVYAFLDHRATSYILAGVSVALHVGGVFLRRTPRQPGMSSAVWLWAPAATVVGLLFYTLGGLAKPVESKLIHATRNFYGLLRVTEGSDEAGVYYALTHGQIEHGAQYLEGYLRTAPVRYYGEGSGAGLALRLHPRRSTGSGALRVGIAGLGAGGLAAYGRPGDVFRFYEINPQVIDIASRFFSYLQDTAATTAVVIGDARLSLERELAQGGALQYDVMIFDAFNGDAIPIHLITAECVDLYRRHLKPDGLMLLHISNQYLDLKPVTRALATHLGWRHLLIETNDDGPEGLYGTTWVILTPNQDFADLSEVQSALTPPDPQDDADTLLWTDDFAALWQVIQK